VLVLFVLDVAPGEVATFKLTGPRDAIQIPNLVVPGGFNTLVAACSPSSARGCSSAAAGAGRRSSSASGSGSR
jgi:hypothetical protein